MTYAVSEGELAVRRKGARAVFRRLVSGGEQSRTELFEDVKGCADWWQGLFMKRLESLGIVEKIGGRSGRYVKWRLARTDEAATFLQALSTDDEALATMLDGLDGRDSKAELYGAGGGGDLDVRLDFALKILAILLENAVYTRETVDEIKGSVDEIKTRMASLEEAFK